jgi:hypothetical protein
MTDAIECLTGTETAELPKVRIPQVYDPQSGCLAANQVVQVSRVVSPKQTCGRERVMTGLGGKQPVRFSAQCAKCRHCNAGRKRAEFCQPLWEKAPRKRTFARAVTTGRSAPTRQDRISGSNLAHSLVHRCRLEECDLFLSCSIRKATLEGLMMEYVLIALTCLIATAATLWDGRNSIGGKRSGRRRGNDDK